MLNNAAVRAARPRAAGYKISDAGGLVLYIAPTGTKSFRWRFRLDGKEQVLTLGTWPEIALDDARTQRDQARARLDRGEDPRVCEIAQTDEVRAFEYIARRWHARMAPRWTEVHARDVLASLERDIFPAIGAMPIAAITTPVVLTALRVIEERGRLETARRVRQRLSAIFGFAMSEGTTSSNPAAIVADALNPPAPPRHHPALLELDEVRALLAAVDELAAEPIVVQASRLLALTGVRLACVRGARWDEIEDLDGAEPLWRIPAARMKMKAAKKLDPANDHLVPLSRQAAELLRTLRTRSQGCDHVAGAGNMIFPGIAEGAIGALYDRAGYEGRHVPHGWRASFSTIMNERAPEDRVVIDRALGHVGSKRVEEEPINRKVEGAYNRSKQLAPRRRVFQAWADALVG